MAPTIQEGKKSVRYRQFSGGYARVCEIEIRALLEGYRQGLVRRGEVRVFAARLEQTALHRKSNVSLYRIVNCRSRRRGNRRLPESEIQTAVEKLDVILPSLRAEFEAQWLADDRQAEMKPAARKVLRHIACGGATTVEALFCLAYFMRRIPQRKNLQRLKPEERYARFRYADFEAWTGVHRATQSRIVSRLINRRYLGTSPVIKQNENRYGQLFVDGPMISLVRNRPAEHKARRSNPSHQPTAVCGRQKRSTPPRVMINSPTQKRSTLRNVDPKREILEQEKLISRIKEGFIGRHPDPELQRMAVRAAEIVDCGFGQAA